MRKVKTNNKFEAFIYMLLRDNGIPLGLIETILKTIEGFKSDEITLSNPFLAKYARAIRKRLEK